MNKLYYNFNSCSTNFRDFFHSIDFSLTNPQLNFLSDLFTSMLSSESINFDKLANSLSDKYYDINFDSVLRRISRFFNNSHLYIHNLFDNLISYIISNYKVKHDENRVFISFDHMFIREKFTVFLLSLKIGKQGFPIFFNVYPGKHKENHGDAFKIKNIKNALSYVHNLFKDIDKDINIVWLADRWFGNLFPLFNFIDNVLKDSFVFRCKDNFKIFYKPIKENHFVWLSIHDLPSYAQHSSFFENLQFTKNKYKYNLTICKSVDHKERWFLISNVDPTRSKKFYGYRFGGIETIFKHQKSNCFYLEKTGVKHLHSFDNLYSLVCIAITYCICLGADVSKNSKCYRNLGFRTVRTINNKRVRVVSLFQTGIRLFHLALNSIRYYRLPFNFKLYDI